MQRQQTEPTQAEPRQPQNSEKRAHLQNFADGERHALQRDFARFLRQRGANLSAAAARCCSRQARTLNAGRGGPKECTQQTRSTAHDTDQLAHLENVGQHVGHVLARVQHDSLNVKRSRATSWSRLTVDGDAMQTRRLHARRSTTDIKVATNPQRNATAEQTRVLLTQAPCVCFGLLLSSLSISCSALPMIVCPSTDTIE
jgi:hypothetical protein